MITLRSTAWDGPAPAVGDVLVDDDGAHWSIVAVAMGPGCGQYRLDVREVSVHAWHSALRYGEADARGRTTQDDQSADRTVAAR